MFWTNTDEFAGSKQEIHKNLHIGNLQLYGYSESDFVYKKQLLCMYYIRVYVVFVHLIHQFPFWKTAAFSLNAILLCVRSSSSLSLSSFSCLISSSNLLPRLNSSILKKKQCKNGNYNSMNLHQSLGIIVILLNKKYTF